MPINGVALSAVGAGVIFIWSGVKGWSVLTTVQDIVSGKAPHGTETNTLVTNTGGSIGSTGVAISASALANEAASWIGKWQYVWGGSPGLSGGRGDCSSFVNFLVGVRGQGAIPGYKAGAYNGSSHGPPTLAWMVWPGCTTVPHSQAQAGDLIVGATHMGICESSNQYISARDPADGVGVNSFSQFPDGSAFLIRRLK